MIRTEKGATFAHWTLNMKKFNNKDFLNRVNFDFWFREVTKIGKSLRVRFCLVMGWKIWAEPYQKKFWLQIDIYYEHKVGGRV